MAAMNLLRFGSIQYFLADLRNRIKRLGIGRSIISTIVVNCAIQTICNNALFDEIRFDYGFIRLIECFLNFGQLKAPTKQVVRDFEKPPDRAALWKGSAKVVTYRGSVAHLRTPEFASFESQTFSQFVSVESKALKSTVSTRHDRESRIAILDRSRLTSSTP